MNALEGLLEDIFAFFDHSCVDLDYGQERGLTAWQGVRLQTLLTRLFDENDSLCSTAGRQLSAYLGRLEDAARAGDDKVATKQAEEAWVNLLTVVEDAMAAAYLAGWEESRLFIQNSRSVDPWVAWRQRFLLNQLRESDQH